MSLIEEYQKLLKEYDQVLELSRLILAELKKGGGEDHLSSLIQKKRITGERISRFSQELSSIKIKGTSDFNLKALTKVKELLAQISQKARLLQEVEEKIQNLLQQTGPE
jgi:hypothetical protein